MPSCVAATDHTLWQEATLSLMLSKSRFIFNFKFKQTLCQFLKYFLYFLSIILTFYLLFLTLCISSNLLVLVFYQFYIPQDDWFLFLTETHCTFLNFLEGIAFLYLIEHFYSLEWVAHVLQYLYLSLFCKPCRVATFLT